MRSTGTAGTGAPADDATARARIRDAAIRRFAVDGFQVGLRAIAADAGVSAGLVVHHFGSKDGLRAECDAHVHATIRGAKTQALGSGGAEQVLIQLAALDEYAPMVGYVFRSLQAGGDLARTFLEHFIADAEGYVGEAVAAGTLRPSRDEHARVRYLTMSGMGAMLVALTLDPPEDFADLSPWLLRYVDVIALPSVELFTEGLFTDRRMLDAYLSYVSDPPEAPRSA